jgi:acyl-CoA dehydrogenase
MSDSAPAVDGAETPEAAFRAELRSWLEAHSAIRPSSRGTISIFSEFRDDPEHLAAARLWQAELAAGGWGAITWPEAFGGRAAGPLEVMAFAEEIARRDVPQGIFTIGTGMMGPTIIAHGDTQQKDRFLPPLLRGEEIWCQLWSEPGAGSDLAGLRARAEIDGDEFVLNGQKVWTSGAHYSDYALGIFRTDPDAPKHKGISCLIVPMATPGIEVRPLRQMTGEAHFNEVFFDDARVPVKHLVGDLHDGWRVARTTLMYERMATGTSISCGESFTTLARLVASCTRDGRPAGDDPLIRQKLAIVYTRARLFDLTTARVRTALASGGIPGAEASILKLAATYFFTELAESGLALLGPGGTLADDDAPEGGRWTDAVNGSFAMHIGGGTDEIQRNIIGETVLGLPREPATDRELPFRELLAREGITPA